MPRTVSFLLFPGFHVLDLALLTVFDTANEQPGGPFYELDVVSLEGGVVASAAGATLDSRPYREDAPASDTLLVFGASKPSSPGPADLAMVRSLAVRARRVAMICDGAHLLAAAGLLAGRRIAMPSRWAGRMQAHYPQLTVEPDRVYMHDGPYWSSGGMLASIDMALAMVEQDLGRDAALAVARAMMMYHWRSSVQSQSASLLHLMPRSDPIQAVLTYARQNLRRPLTIDELAAQAGMSRRHFTRSFRAATGQSPARVVQSLRAEAARILLENSSLPLETIARDAGFASREQMRRALARVHGGSAPALRRATRAA